MAIKVEKYIKKMFIKKFTRDKKALIASHNYWIEMIGSIILVLGFFFATFSGSGFMSVLILFLSGMIFGRIRYRTRDHSKMPFLVLTLFFLFGYIVGSIILLRLFNNTLIWTSMFILVFVVGSIVSYILHKNNIIRGGLF